MRTSTKGILDILQHEAIVTRRYKDSVGVWTWGVGHTANAGPPNPVTITEDRPVEEAIAQFRKDLRKFERRVESAVKVQLQQHEFDALVSFDFNTGGIHRASLVDALNAGDRALAAKRFMAWLKPASITERRKSEQRLFRDGKYANTSGLVSVYPASDTGKVLWKKGRKVNALRLMSGGGINDDNLAASSVMGAALPNSMLRVDKQWRTRGNLRKLQKALYSKGYVVVGVPDGMWGPNTLSACEMFVRERNMPANTVIDAAFLSRVQNSSGRVLPESRTKMTVGELASRGSKITQNGLKAATGATVVAGGLGAKTIESVTNTVDKFAEPIERNQTRLEWLWETFGSTILWVGGFVIGLFILYWVGMMIYRRLKDEQTGKTMTVPIPVQVREEREEPSSPDDDELVEIEGLEDDDDDVEDETGFDDDDDDDVEDETGIVEDNREVVVSA